MENLYLYALKSDIVVAECAQIDLSNTQDTLRSTIRHVIKKTKKNHKALALIYVVSRTPMEKGDVAPAELPHIYLGGYMLSHGKWSALLRSGEKYDLKAYDMIVSEQSGHITHIEIPDNHYVTVKKAASKDPSCILSAKEQTPDSVKRHIAACQGACRME